jgi:hypothetical protein
MYVRVFLRTPKPRHGAWWHLLNEYDLKHQHRHIKNPTHATTIPVHFEG